MVTTFLILLVPDPRYIISILWINGIYPELGASSRLYDVLVISFYTPEGSDLALIVEHNEFKPSQVTKTWSDELFLTNF